MTLTVQADCQCLIAKTTVQKANSKKANIFADGAKTANT